MIDIRGAAIRLLTSPAITLAYDLLVARERARGNGALPWVKPTNIHG